MSARISLSGAVPPVAQTTFRLKEAAKLGFARAFAPYTAKSEAGDAGMALRVVGPLMEIVAEVAPKVRCTKLAHTAGQE